MPAVERSAEVKQLPIAKQALALARPPDKITPAANPGDTAFSLDSSGKRVNHATDKNESLADQVRALGGGPFHNYHRIFKSKIADFIREYLQNDVFLSGSLRGNTDKNRENNIRDAKGIIYRYIINSYDQENFSWWDSNARKEVEEKGFFVSEISTVIARCFNHVKDMSLMEEYSRIGRR